MSNTSQNTINLINKQIERAENNMAKDEANTEFTQYQKQLNANYYRGAINYLHILKNQIESTLTWRDR